MLPSNIPSFQKGSRLLNGTDVQKLADLIGSTEIGIEAQADGTKANATQLNAAISVVTEVAGDLDSVLLPLGYAGLQVVVVNANPTNSIQVFGKGIDLINEVATATGVTQAKGTSALYVCSGIDPSTGAAHWFRILSA